MLPRGDRPRPGAEGVRGLRPQGRQPRRVELRGQEQPPRGGRLRALRPALRRVQEQEAGVDLPRRGEGRGRPDALGRLADPAQPEPDRLRAALVLPAGQPDEGGVRRGGPEAHRRAARAEQDRLPGDALLPAGQDGGAHHARPRAAARPRRRVAAPEAAPGLRGRGGRRPARDRQAPGRGARRGVGGRADGGGRLRARGARRRVRARQRRRGPREGDRGGRARRAPGPRAARPRAGGARRGPGARGLALGRGGLRADGRERGVAQVGGRGSRGGRAGDCARPALGPGRLRRAGPDGRGLARGR